MIILGIIDIYIFVFINFFEILSFFVSLLYYNVNFLRFLILIEFLVLFYIIGNEINTWLFLIFLVFSVRELVLLIRINYELGHQKFPFY